MATTPTAADIRAAEKIVTHVEQADLMSPIARAELLDALAVDLGAVSNLVAVAEDRAAHAEQRANVAEERLEKVETQTRVLAEAVIAITTASDIVAPAVQAVKEEM
jgi:hypothetical protein